jgi:hypothetical protein
MVECLPRPVWRPEFKPHYCKKNKEQNNEWKESQCSVADSQ